MENYADWHKRLNDCARRLYGTDDYAEYPLTDDGETQPPAEEGRLDAKLRVGIAGAHPKTCGTWLNLLDEAHFAASFLQPADDGRYAPGARFHLIVQVIRGTQPVSQSDKVAWESLSDLVPMEQHVFVVDEMDGVNREERAEVCRYIEEKLATLKPLRSPVLYVSMRTGEGLEALVALFQSWLQRKRELLTATEQFRLVRRFRQIRRALEREIDELVNADRRIAGQKQLARAAIRRLQQSAEKMIVYLQAQKDRADAHIRSLTVLGEAEWEDVLRFWREQAEIIRKAGRTTFPISDESCASRQGISLELPDFPGNFSAEWEARNADCAAALQKAVKEWANAAIGQERERLRTVAGRKDGAERLTVLREMERHLDQLAAEVGVNGDDAGFVDGESVRA